MKPFFITVDTEGDALWDNPKTIKTENVLWIPRFQELCEKYGFIPIWLTDYEIICDDRYVEYIKPKAHKGLCEVGIHVHARNNPPLIKLEGEVENGAAFLIEYPVEVRKEKFIGLRNLIEEKIGLEVKTHRAGRWTMDEAYVDLLVEEGIKYDCSVTPGIDWSNCAGIVKKNKGSNYANYRNGRQILKGSENKSIVEYPVSIDKTKSLILPSRMGIKSSMKSVYHFIKHTDLWLRPNTSGNINEMKYLLRNISKNGEYAEFMIHSSELMPGGGPRHQGEAEVKVLFDTMDKLFKYAVELGFRGYTFDTWENK